MNNCRDSPLNTKRKLRFSVNGGRMSSEPGPYQTMSPLGRPKAPSFSVPGHHLQRFRKGYGAPCKGIRQAAFRKSVLNKFTSHHFEKDVAMSVASSKQNASDTNSNTPLNLTSNNTSNDRKEKPATFVCEGIEVDFESSDSEDEVQPLRVLKVLKKTDNVSGCGKGMHVPVVTCHSDDKDISGPRHKLLQRFPDGRSPQMNGLPNGDHARGGMQMPVPAPGPVLLTPPRPSYVVLSGLRRRPVSSVGSSGPMSNCAIIKRPRYLLSQPIRPPMRQSGCNHQRFNFPPFLETSVTPLVDEKCVGLTPEEVRIIEDVLDMMEEVERRMRYALPF